MVGDYRDSASVLHGFVLSRGVFTTTDFPDAGWFTIAYGISPRGDIVGQWGGTDLAEHGFVMTKAK